MGEEAKAATVSAGERVAGVLRERITEGHLLSGTSLRDVALSTEFGVARHTLRAALRLLEYEGLVVHQMHKGAVVKTLSVDDVHEIYRIRRTLELGAVEQSAFAPTDRLADLDTAVRTAERAVTGKAWNEVGTASLRFHQALVALLGSASIDRFFRGVLTQLRLAFATIRDEAAWQTPWIPRDREICNLVRRGSRDSARALTAQYLDDSEKGVLDVVRAHRNRR
ncbi:MAG: FCD domain-containing protein [Streptosporangiales bacterium]|nr:FCD domain-containing protein [Streptosporangiales bacterium]